MKHAQYVIPMMAAALAFSTGVSAESMSKEQYKSEMTRIKGEYESAKQRCDTLSGNAKDVCVAEAKGQEKVAKAFSVFFWCASRSAFATFSCPFASATRRTRRTRRRPVPTHASLRPKPTTTSRRSAATT